MRIFRLFILFIFCSAAAVAQQKSLTSELLMEIKRVSGPQVSPDGNTVAYTVSTVDIEANRNFSAIYIQPVKGGEPVIVSEPKTSLSQPRWRPDGQKIGYLAAVDGDMQLFEIDPKGGSKNQVSSIKGGVSNYSYSPDGNYIMFTQDVKVDSSLQEMYPDLKLDKVKAVVTDNLNYRHWDTWHDGTYQHVFFALYKDGKVTGKPIDIMAGEPYDAPLKPFGGDNQLTWSPDGKKIIYTSKKVHGTQYAVSTNSDLYLYDLVTGGTVNLTSGYPGYEVDPLYSPDGKQLAYLSMARGGYEADKNRLFVMDMITGTKTDLTQDFDQTIEKAIWSADGKKLYFISGINATHQLYEYNFSPASGQSNIRKITDGLHDYVDVALAGTNSAPVLVGAKMSISSPITIYTINPATGAETRFSMVNKELLDQVKWGKVEKRMVKAADGKEVLTWVIYPPDFDANKKYPALLYAQGGPQSPVSQFFSYRWNFQLMAAKGYIVIAPNRRGLPTFGQAWTDAIVGDYGGKPMQDLISAVDDVAKEKFVDKENIGAVGASFGGYTVFWLAGHNESKRFKTFIAHAGMFNMESWYGSTEEMFFANNDQKGSYWDNPLNYEKNSPHKFVKNWNTPILIIHGEKDYRVPVTQGMEAFNAAQLKGIPSRFLYFPDENHWILKPQNGLLWQRVFFDWLDEHLKN